MYALHCKYNVFNNDRRPVKVFQSVSFTGLLIFRFACMGQRIIQCKQPKEPSVDAATYGQYKTLTEDHGLRTGYKTQTRYKMRTADYLGKNCANWFKSR